MERKLRWYKEMVVFTVMFIFVGISFATDFPTKPIEWIAPHGASPSAMALKIVMDTASKYLGQPALMVQVAGAGGAVGTARVARAKPDGYTLLQASSAGLGTSLYTLKDLPYTLDDFEYFAQYGCFTIALLVRADSPYKTLEDFLEYAKKHPGEIKVATQGVGAGQHLCLELLKLKTGGPKIDMVVFKTTFEMRTSVLGGHAHASFLYGGAGGPSDEYKQALEGGGRILAVASKDRLKSYPDIPTFVEKGLDIFYSSYYGIAGPKGMPKEVSLKLKDAIYKALEDPVVIKAIEDLGFRYEFLKSEEFTKKVHEFGATIKKVVEEANIPKT